MKKTKKLLSIVLAVLVALGTLPIIQVAPVAADSVATTYAFTYVGNTGTLEKPTKPVLAEGKYTRNDLYKMNVSIENTTYHFYQTVDNEYFSFTQSLGLQQVNSGASDRYLDFGTITDYTGSSNVDGNADGVSNGTHGYFEYPVIVNNNTAEFVSSSRVSEEWIATNENAKEAVSANTNKIPSDFRLEGSSIDLSGCKVYAWNNNVVFKGSDASETTETVTVYKNLTWNWVDRDDSTQHAEMDFRFGTVIEVVDARELAIQLVKAQNILANPENYTKEYVSSVEATYNSIPDDLKDFSAYYTQEQVNSFTQSLKDISLNSADYSIYNEYYRELRKLDNHTGSWTDKSFAVFKAEISAIDSGLPKNLDKTQQATVDAATQALIAAYEKLVSTDVSEETPGNDFRYGDEDDENGNMFFEVDDTTFKFMQTKDDQVFEYSQLWKISRDGGNTARTFGGIILETGLPLTCGGTCLSNPNLSVNNTQTFINHLHNCSTTVTADNEQGNSVTATEFSCWWEEQADGTPNETSTFVDGTGTLDSNRDFEYSNGKTYYLRNTPQIKGNPAGTYGSLSFNYVLRTGWTYKTGGFLGLGATKNYRHIHINNTVEITDVRQLIAAVDAAEATIENPGTHSAEYISALKAAVASVPEFMLSGNEFYSQAEVDKLANAILSVREDSADYSEFAKVFEAMTSVENEGKYTEDSFKLFIDEIYLINANLPKNLGKEEQATVDAALSALYTAANKLTYRHLNESDVMTELEIQDSMGNSPVDFKVSSTNYSFMQVTDGQKFVIKTDLTIKNTKSSYKSKLLSLKISQLDASTLNVCANRSEPDAGCHYGENVLRNDYALLLSGVTDGVNVFTSANDAGDIAEFNNWQNVSGTPLTSGGIITDGVVLSNSDSSATAQMVYTGAVGGTQNTSVNVQYALRLGWSYQEVVLGVEGTSTSRHAHIPVTLNITDARALNELYSEAIAAVTGKTDKTYTLQTLEQLYGVLVTIPTDMVYGDKFYSQDNVNDEYNKLKAAFDSLKEGADYSEYFAECVNVDKVLVTNNKDAYGNKLYTEEAYNEYKATVESITSTIDKNLDATQENQAIIDNATQALKDARTTLEGNKLANYEAFSKALDEANHILTEPAGTYTDETIAAVQAAVDNANSVNKDLAVGEQATVDAATSALEGAVADALFRADYTEYEVAKALAEAIKNEDGTYTDKAYAAFLEKLAQIDEALDKNLPDYAVNRQTISASTQAVKDAVTELNNNKKGDYTEFEAELNESNAVVNDDGNGNTVYNPQAFEEFKNAVNNADTALDRDLTEHEQGTIDSATQALKDAQQTLENNRWADYTELEANMALVQEILDAPEGIYTDATVQAAQQAMDTANAIPDGLVVGENNVYQNQIDSAAAALESAKNNAQIKADYSDLNTTKTELEKIVNAPEGTYTDATVNAAQAALAAAEALNKDLPDSQQSEIDSVTDAMQNAIDNAQIKADYSEFDSTKAELENIVNAPEGTYTDATVNAAQAALAAAEALNKDLPDSQQSEIDSVTDAMQNVIDNAQNKADYTDYNNVKSELEDVISSGNVDGNGDKLYDDAVFEELKNTLTQTDNALDKDLPDSQQAVVDTAVSTLEEIQERLENSKIYTITFVGEDGTSLAVINYTNGTLLKNIAGKPELPEGTDTFKYIGWVTADDVLYTDESLVNGDVTVYYAGEFIKIDTTADSTIVINDASDYAAGVDNNTTVAELKAQLENDLTYIEIKDYTGAALTDESLVGSGSTITLKSRYTGVIYETKTIIVIGDVDGDGDVDNDDYAIARNANIEDAQSVYTVDNVYLEFFFLANDVNGDGYIDVLDTRVIALIKNGLYVAE